MYSNAFILNILLYIFIIHKVSSICTEYGQHVSCDTIYDVAKHYDSSWRKLFIRNTDSFQYLTELEICPSIDDLSELIINEYLFKIHPNAFSQLKKLWSLKLVNNRILTMEENTFNGLKTLEHLSLESNKIEKLDVNFLGDCTANVITLNNNNISEIKTKTFTKSSIHWLTIENNRIKSLDSHCFSKNLQRLSLKNNLIENVTRGVFDDLVYLSYLNLRGNKLKKISFVQGMVNLVTLIVDHNSISEIEDRLFEKTFQLEVIKLGFNNISYLPVNLINIRRTRLRELDLKFNKLVSPGLSLGNVLGRLKKISYFGNPWSCPCLFQIEKIIQKKLVKLHSCDVKYIKEELPICVEYGHDDCWNAHITKVKKIEYKEFLKRIALFSCNKGDKN